jgi:UDP-2,3-diacylglucosamine hydrolase
MTTLFVSDLHLDDERPELTRAFLHLLQEEGQQSEALYILGDLFEAWVGDDDDSSVACTVISALRDLTGSGVPVYFIHGNRDFLVGPQFAETSGCQILPDPSVIDLYDEQVLLMHGDSLCTDDTQYMEFRGMVRSKTWQSDILARPLEERRTLARQLRENSVEAKSNKAEDIMNVNPDEVVRVMAAHGVQTLIHGHTHRPAVHSLRVNGREAKRCVLGDWDKHGWVLRANPGQQSLDSFDITD